MLNEQEISIRCVNDLSGDSYDDVFKNLARVMEDIFSNLNIDDRARFVGCTIISGSGDTPKMLHLDEAARPDLQYEIYEDSERIYISAIMPPNPEHLPVADIRSELVIISVNGTETKIGLPKPVDITHCYYEIRNGVMDINCCKI